ncbi:hypothetical protein VOM14_20225 [Paraburkholderia sp. MPAMCS5]|uniref:hypothetical protein n=1 Tax=Paraburkholderia sp. MPAMCS5 TaxID=3112563 RepID=UPI002E18EC45|nr:hypothetical protein [Paraburkholderia sp. MPAMCS5]
MKTILLLSTYPYARPRHGGQVRLANIAKNFADRGWAVTGIAVYEAESCAPEMLGQNDIAFPDASPYRYFAGHKVPFITDLMSGKFAVADDGAFKEILKRLPSKLDVVHVEQPWLWPVAERIKQLHEYSNVKLIYGSANIETPLKREIFESYGVQASDDVFVEIANVEMLAAKEADITVAVTQSDLDVLISWGARRPVLAPNGIAPWKATGERLDYWKARLPTQPWMLYVASAHPPNFTGFHECIGGALGCFPPGSKLVVAGSVCEHLHRTLADSRWSSLNLSRLELLFVLNDEDLSAVKELAHGFLLPIPHGGGSNIKTAEALYSRKHVVGTPSAFRGFEEFVTMEGVHVAHSPRQFHAAIRDVLARDDLPIVSSNMQEKREQLTWARSLESIVNVAEDITTGSNL